jgi:hypothetical protein
MANTLIPGIESFQVNTLSGGSLTTGLVSYYPLAGNPNDFYDSNNLSPSGSPTYTTGPVNYATSLVRGSSQWFSAASNGGITGGNISLAGWINIQTQPTSGQEYILFSQFDNGTQTGYDFDYKNTSGTYTLTARRNEQNVADDSATYTVTLTPGTWYFIVLTSDGSTFLKLYLNNSLEATQNTLHGNGSGSLSSALSIGLAFNTTGNGPTGYLAEFGVWSKVLSANEMSDLYNSGSGQTMISSKVFQVDTTSSLDTGLVSYWKFEGNSNDFFGTNYGTDTSVTYGTSYGKVGQGGNYAGSGYSSMGNVLGFEYNQPWSIAAWIYNQTSGSSNIISKQESSIPYRGYGIGTAGSGQIQIFLNNNGSGNTLEKTYVTYSGGWHYMVFTYSGSNTLAGMNLYVDGSLASPSESSGSGMTASILSTTPFQLSGRGGAANLWTAYLDEVGIWSKALSTQEITDLYNGGAGQTMVGLVSDVVNDTDVAPTIIVPQLGTIGAFDVDIDTDTVSGVTINPLHINISDTDLATDTATIQIPSLGQINVSDTESDGDAVTIQIPTYLISVSDINGDGDVVAIQVPTLGVVSVNDTEYGTDSVANIALNPLQLVVNDIEYANELVFMREFEFFVSEDYDVDQDFVSIIIPTLLLSVSDIELETDIVPTMSGTKYVSISDVELESESVTIQNPTLGAISVYDTDIDVVSSVTVQVPSVGTIDITDIELEQESSQFELVSYINTSDVEVEGENISIKVYTPGTFLVQDTEVASESVTIKNPSVGAVTISDSEALVDVLTTRLTSDLRVSDTEGEADIVADIEIIEEGLFASDTETLSEFISIGIIRIPRISRTIQNTYNQPSIVLTP